MAHRARYREIITHYRKLGQNSFGPVYDDDGEVCKGYVEPSSRRIVSADGAEVTSSFYAELGPETEDRVDVGDKAVWKGKEYVVLSVNPIRPKAKTDHLEVYYGPFGESG